MNKTRVKLQKPSKIKRKLTLSKEKIARLTDQKRPDVGDPRRCTYYGTGCLPYTC